MTFCRNFHTGKENTISFATMSFKTRNHTVVVAIYFGTTYSDYAFSFRSDFLKDEHDHLNRISTDSWNCDDFVSDKTPTTLLIDKTGNLSVLVIMQKMTIVG